MLDNLKSKKLSEEELEKVVGGIVVGGTVDTDTPPFHLFAKVRTTKGDTCSRASSSYSTKEKARRQKVVFYNAVVNQVKDLGGTVKTCRITLRNAGNQDLEVLKSE